MSAGRVVLAVTDRQVEVLRAVDRGAELAPRDERSLLSLMARGFVAYAEPLTSLRVDALARMELTERGRALLEALPE